MKFLKIGLIGIIYAVISWAVHTLSSFLSMGYYTDPAYLSVWSKIMMPTAGPPPLHFYIYSFVFSLITGIIFAAVYLLIKRSLPQKEVWKRGIAYGLLVFLIGAIPGYLMIALLINLPLALIISWAVETLIINLILGIITVKLLK